MSWTNPKTWSVGETLTAANFNTHIRDNLNALPEHLLVRTTSTQSVSSQTTVQNHTTLLVPVGASEVWQFRLNIWYTSPTTADFKYNFTFPTNGEFRSCALVLLADATTVQWADLGGVSSTGGTASSSGEGSAWVNIPITAVYIGGGTAGNVQFQFAQISSDAGSTTVQANSTWWGVRLA